MLLRTSQGFSTLLYPLCLWWPRETVPFLHFGSVIWSCRAGRASGLLFWSEWQWHIYVDEPYWVPASSESSPPRQHSPFSGIEAAGDIGLGYNEVERRHSKSFMWICQGTSTYDVRKFWTPPPLSITHPISTMIMFWPTVNADGRHTWKLPCIICPC